MTRRPTLEGAWRSLLAVRRVRALPTIWACIELVESSPDERLFSGVVDPSRVDELGAVLAGLGLRYSIELWSDDRTSVLRELAG